MEAQNFSIQQLKLDVDFFSKERTHELQNTLSRLYHQQIHGTLQDFFYKVLPEDILIRKDNLVVDLGSVAEDQLESELARRLKEALKALFDPILSAEKTTQQWKSNGFESITFAAGDQSLLDFYLVNGTFPWQASAGQGTTLTILLSRLYAQDRNSLGALLQRLGRQSVVRKRLAFQSSDDDMEKVITAIIPIEAPHILSYRKRIIGIQQEKQVVKNPDNFAGAVSFFILNYLLKDQESRFSQKMLIKSVVAQMAAHYNVSYFSLLALMHAALSVNKQVGRTADFFGLIEELEMEDHNDSANPYLKHWQITTTAAKTIPPVILLNQKIALLYYYLANGTLPAWSASFDLGKEELKACLKEGMETIPSTLRELVFSIIGNAAPTTESFLERLRELLPRNGFGAFLRFLWPEEALFAEPYLLLLSQLSDKGQLGTSQSGSLEMLQAMMLKYFFKSGNLYPDRESFINFSLQYLSDHRNITRSLILENLIAAINNEVKPVLSAHLSLLKKSSQLSTTKTHPTSEIAFPVGLRSTSIGGEIEKLTVRRSTLSDLLNYFLYYGIMPWWGKEFRHFAPETILRNLLITAANEAQLVMKKAGMRQESRQRFLEQFPENLIYPIFSTLPDWDLTLLTIKKTTEQIESIPVFSQMTDFTSRPILLEAVWHSYRKQGYRTFNSDYFYNSIFQEFYRYSKTAPDGNFIITEVIRFFRGLVSNETIKTIIKQLSHEKTRSGENSALGNLDAFLLQQTGAMEPLSVEGRQQEVIRLLEYYLTWNRLPDNFPALSGQELDNRLTEMLLLLYYENRSALKRLMGSEKHSASAHMHIHNMFLADHKGGDHKQLSQLLDDYIEKDALHYLREIFGKANIAEGTGLKPALGRLLEKARNGEEGEQLSQLLQSAALTRYIASNYGAETMKWLMEKQFRDDRKFQRQSEAVHRLFLKLIAGIHEKQRLTHLLNEATLFYLYGKSQYKNSNDLISAVLKYLAGSVYAPSELFRILLHKIENDTYLAAVHQQLAATIRNKLMEELHVQDQELSIQKQMQSKELKTREAALKALEQKIAEELSRQQQQEDNPKETLPERDKGEKLYIGNAGLVLLHPFLSTYFTRLKLMESGQFVSLEAQARAVHLLQYLAFTTTSNPEQDLVLNKILCNYPLYEPLPLEIVISKEEADLSLELIQVVIQRSGKLKNSSPEGFRSSFLQREGMITETAQEWTLRVDQRGYDLILQTLPWAFGLIKFQWMDKPMIIEWI